VPPHTGRGGWTWYTGTAAWTYRLIVEAILGLRREAGALVIDPCLPPHWPGYEATVREGGSVYRVKVENPGAGGRVGATTLDGKPLAEARVPLQDDGREHEVVVRLVPAEAAVEEAGLRA
jgi:cellobiose phosphorylase